MAGDRAMRTIQTYRCRIGASGCAAGSAKTHLIVTLLLHVPVGLLSCVEHARRMAAEKRSCRCLDPGKIGVTASHEGLDLIPERCESAPDVARRGLKVVIQTLERPQQVLHRHAALQARVQPPCDDHVHVDAAQCPVVKSAIAVHRNRLGRAANCESCATAEHPELPLVVRP
jgi:hypothetical protein